MVDDLEGLSQAIGYGGTAVSGRPAAAEVTVAADDVESLRVDDLCVPLPRRGVYEVVPEPAERHEGFELINFETEADILTLS